MFDSGTLLIIPFLADVAGADQFNFYFSLVSASGLLVFVPAAIMKLIQRA